MTNETTRKAFRIDIQPTVDGRFYAWVGIGYGFCEQKIVLGIGDTPIAAAHDARNEMRLRAKYAAK